MSFGHALAPPAARPFAHPLETVACLSCGAVRSEPFAESPAQMHEAAELFAFSECSECGLVRLSPRPPASAIARYYDESYLPHRGARAWGRFATLVAMAERGTDRARVRRVTSARRLSGDSRVLDVGCGRPSFLKALHDRTRARATGLDFTDEGWRHDRAAFEGLELLHGTLDAVPLEPGFDVITMWHALEHEYAPLDTLRRLRSLAAPGAALVVEVPDLDSLSFRRHGAHWAGFHTPRHTAAYTPRTLRALLERAGWKVEMQLRHGTLDPYVLWWLGRQELLGRSLRTSLESRFVSFVAGKVAAFPLTLLQRWIPLGVQTAIARPA